MFQLEIIKKQVQHHSTLKIIKKKHQKHRTHHQTPLSTNLKNHPPKTIQTPINHPPTPQENSKQLGEFLCQTSPSRFVGQVKHPDCVTAVMLDPTNVRPVEDVDVPSGKRLHKLTVRMVIYRDDNGIMMG